MAQLQNIHLGNNLPQQNSADSRFIALTVHTNRNFGVQINFFGIKCRLHLIDIGENLAFAGAVVDPAGHVVGPQHNILAGYDNGTSVGR